MGRHELSLNIDDATKQRLEEEARWQHQDEAAVAADAIRAYLDRQAHLRKLLDDAGSEADKGIFVSREAMMGWVKDRLDGKRTPSPQADTFFPPRGR